MRAVLPTSVEAPGSGQAVIREEVNQLPLWRRAGRVLFICSQLMVVWWWATIPAVVASLVLTPIGGGIVLAVVVVGSRWVPPIGIPVGFGRRLWVDHRRALASSCAVGFKMAWPWISSHAAVNVTTNGYWRAPKIIAYERDMTHLRPEWRRVTIKPLPLQHRETWPKLADQVMRTLNQAEVATTVDAKHRLTMTFTRTEMPEFVALPLHRDDEREDFVPLGVGVDGQEIGWKPDEAPHITVTGITKGGKGVTVRNIEAHAVKHGWLIYRANPKLTGESDWLESYASIADSPPGMWAQSQHVLELMYERQRLIKAAGVDDWHQVPGIGPRILYEIDEGANLISPVIRDERRPYAQATSSNVTSEAAMARSAGIHIVYVTQQPGVDSYGFAGGQVRLNIEARMIIGKSDEIWLRELFLGDINPSVRYALAAGIKGRAVFQGLDPDHRGEVRKAQIYYATQHDVASLLPAEPPEPPVDFDELGPDRWASFVETLADQENAGRQRRRPKKQRPSPEQEAA